MISRPRDTMRPLEERQFTNPHVRFRRINGRIVPIVNQKRIGQDLNNYGKAAIKVGAITTAAGAGIHYARKSRQGKDVGKAVSSVARFGSRVGAVAGFKSKPASTVKALTFKRRVLGFGKAAVFGVARNPVKVGVTLLGAGIAARAFGSELEMRSPLGKDIFINEPKP